ncbi:hypothetical protein IGI04_042429, partial [Brassica rapa subsp. trilocularis]
LDVIVYCQTLYFGYLWFTIRPCFNLADPCSFILSSDPYAAYYIIIQHPPHRSSSPYNLKHGHSRPRDHVPFLTMAFLYMYMANTPIPLLDTLNLHVYLSNLYDCMSTHSWVHAPRLSLYVQVLFSYASLYKCVCVSTPSCGPLLPSSLASQDYMVWYLRCLAGQPYLYVWSDGFIDHAIRVPGQNLITHVWLKFSLNSWEKVILLSNIYSQSSSEVMDCVRPTFTTAKSRPSHGQVMAKSWPSRL